MLEAANCLHQKVNIERRPWLKPMWSGANYKAYGWTKALVEIADRRIDDQLETPAMCRRMREKAQTDQVVPESSHVVTDNDYAEITVPVHAEDFRSIDELIELVTDVQAAETIARTAGITLGRAEAERPIDNVPAIRSSGINTDRDTGDTTIADSGVIKRESPTSVQRVLSALRPRKMCAKLEYPSDYFVHKRDNHFHRWNNMFLAVSREQVKPQITHQLGRSEDVERLLDSLMTGASALRDYPSGCPPPAAIRPLRPSMRDSAKLVFTVQHSLSNTAQAAHKRFVATQLEYGIDEKTRAHAQMPVFTRPKPNTDACCVLFDDSENNGLNMALTKYNLLFNILKRVFATTKDVEVLGILWSTERSWKVPYHRIAILQYLPMPTMISAIHRMAGSINAISEHLNWSQTALLPFYQKLGKARLSAADIVELEPAWHDLKLGLLDMETLYIAPHGVLFTLQVDAAATGIGAVLLAHKVLEGANDDGEVASGKEYLWPAKAVVETVKHFHAYLDGCANLHIESDASNVIGLYSHKTANKSDGLSCFQAELAALGVTCDMIVHRPSEEQKTTDWLSRVHKCIRPHKTRKLTLPPDSDALIVGMLTSKVLNDDPGEESTNVAGPTRDLKRLDAVTDNDDGNEFWAEYDAPTNADRTRPFLNNQRNKTTRNFIQYRDRQALLDLPQVSEFVPSQGDNETIVA
ncbi:hypothetical protein H4R24_000918 [Coemansia sp. RSA 988]|nr:hypothetical protein H4R24_000918 [Coemansia sp. RSA 988]